MNRVAKATLGLMIATMISKILGFAREIVLASTYGASAYTDAYLTVLNMPNVIFSAIGAALATTFIPVYYEIKNKNGESEANLFTNNITNVVLIICITIAILSLIFTEPLVKIFAIGFEGETLRLAIKFARIIMLGVVFLGLSNLMTAYLQINNNFAIPGLTGIPFNVCIIISILLSINNTSLLAWGTLLGLAGQFLLQLPFAIKKGYKYKPYLRINDENIRKVIWLVGPVFIGIGVTQINSMVDRSLASTLTEGSISALNYSNRLIIFVIAMFITSISSVIYPMLSKLTTENNKEKFIETVTRSVNSIVLLIMPISIGAIIFSKPIIRILFQRGEFNDIATNMTASALVCYSIGLIGISLRDILGKVFYSIQDTKTPMKNGILAMIINIILNFILVKYMKHNGLALATSISAIVTIILLFISLKRKVGYFGEDKIIKGFIKTSMASSIMGVISGLAYKYIATLIPSGSIYEIINLAISVILGCITYLICILILKVEEIQLIYKKIILKMSKNIH